MTLTSERITKVLAELGPASVDELAILTKTPCRQTVSNVLQDLKRDGRVKLLKGKKWTATGVPYARYANREER